MNDTPGFSQAFESLRAEFESAWLERVYLQPREFGLMAGQHSILVIGAEGTGKTALEMQLKAYAMQKEKPLPLVASWRPQPITETHSSEQVVENFLAQAMNSLAFAFLQEVAQRPEAYLNAGSWVQDFIIWFIHFYLQGDREFHLSRLSENAAPSGLETIKKIITATPRPLLLHGTPASRILAHLTETVKKLGYAGVWIFVEDLDIVFRSSPDQLTQDLKDLLSTLDIFQTPDFSIKIVAPSELGLRLQSARGVNTRRFNVHYLDWQFEDLLDIVQKRLALVLKREQISLGEICGDKNWFTWLRLYAGDSPRGWLDLTRPIVSAYLKKQSKLSGSEWPDVYRQSPPLLSMDLDGCRVFIGHGEVTVSSIGFKLLRYLYENRYRSCSKSELYFRAHKGLPKEPRSKDDEGWEDQSSWEGTLDTALWRLRQSIEWDNGRKPIYIVSAKGRGQIRLKNTG